MPIVVDYSSDNSISFILPKQSIIIGKSEFDITQNIIEVLNKKIKSQINITMIHGSKDEVVPPSYSKKVLRIFNKANKKLVIIKNGDHSLSSKQGLKRIILELNKIVFNII